MNKATIQFSNSLKSELSKMKISKNESFEEVIWDLIEDRKELSKETFDNILEAEEDVNTGQVIIHAEL